MERRGNDRRGNWRRGGPSVLIEFALFFGLIAFAPSNCPSRLSTLALTEHRLAKCNIEGAVVAGSPGFSAKTKGVRHQGVKPSITRLERHRTLRVDHPNGPWSTLGLECSTTWAKCGGPAIRRERRMALCPEADDPHSTQPGRPDSFPRFLKAVVRPSRSLEELPSRLVGGNLDGVAKNDRPAKGRRIHVIHAPRMDRPASPKQSPDDLGQPW